MHLTLDSERRIVIGMSSNTVSVLVPSNALSSLKEMAPTLGEYHVFGEVSCRLGNTFNWAGNTVLCDEEVPEWSSLLVDTDDFHMPGWAWVFDTFPAYTAF